MKQLRSSIGRRVAALAAAALLAVGAALPAAATYNLPITTANEGESIYLYNMDNDTVLLDENSTEIRYVASTTKMMTALLLIESGQDLENTVITIPKCINQEFKDIQATNGTGMNLKVGEEIRLIDLLYGLIVRSANDAASVIAWHLTGGGDTYNAAPFVEMMNQRARELGCTGTTFGCPHGLYDHGNVSTAQDLARIAEACFAQPLYMQVATTLSYTLPMTNKHQYERTIENVNLMMQPGQQAYREYISGMKTGFTTLAGRCFVTTASQNGDTYMLVILGSTKDAIYTETAALLDWAFGNFSNRVLLEMTNPVQTLPLKGCDESETLELYAARSVAAYGHNQAAVTMEYDLPEAVRAPIKQNKVVGTVTVKMDGEVIDTVDLLAGASWSSALLDGLVATILLLPVLLIVLVVLIWGTVLYGGVQIVLPRKVKRALADAEQKGRETLADVEEKGREGLKNLKSNLPKINLPLDKLKIGKNKKKK